MVIHRRLLSRNKRGSFAIEWLMDVQIDTKKKCQVDSVNLVSRIANLDLSTIFLGIDKANNSLFLINISITAK